MRKKKHATTDDLDSFRDRLVNYYDSSTEITTDVVEIVARTILHHRGKIKDKGINDSGCHEWWICDALGKPVYIAFQAKRKISEEPNRGGNMEQIMWQGSGSVYFLENGIIKVKPLSDTSRTLIDLPIFSYENSWFIQELLALGYHPIKIRLSDLLDQFIGHSYDEFLDEIKARVGRNAKRKASQPTWAEKQQKWKELRDRFNGVIIGFDKQYLNIHSSGFSIRILMKTMSKEDRKSFVDENKEKILRWCKEEMPSKVLRRIGSMDYYTPSEIAILTANEIEVFYEIKKNELQL